MRCGLDSAANTAGSSATSFAAAPVTSRSGAFGAALAAMGPFLPHLDDAVPRPRHRTLDEQQILLRVDVVDDKADLRDPLAAEATGHAHALEHARRRRRGAHGAGLADVVRAVRLRAAMKPVALDRARKALADRGTCHLHRIPGLERLDGHRVAHRQLG